MHLRWGPIFRRPFAVLVLFSCLASGCGSDAEDPPSYSLAELRALGQLYGAYVSRHGGLPSDRDGLSAFAAQMTGNDIEKIALSPRDGRPLVLLFGRPVGSSEQDGFPWVAYEQSEVAGTRLAVTSRGGVYELNAEQFQQAFPDAE